MDWSLLGIHTITTITSYLAILFLSSEDHFQKETQFISEAILKGDLKKATGIWKDITEVEGVRRTSYLIQEIISQAFNHSNSEKDRVQNLSKFIHTTIPISEKPSSYAMVFKFVEQTGCIYNDSSIFALAKYIAKDKVQSEKIEYETHNGKSITDLYTIIPSPVWSLVNGKNVILRNAKYSSYLFLSSDGSKQMLAWKHDQLVNKRQAIFQFHSETENLDGDKFTWIQPMWNVTIQVAAPTDLTDTSGSGSLHGVARNNKQPDARWTIELVNDDVIRISCSSVSQKGILFVREPTHDLDNWRSQVTIAFDKMTIQSLGTESYWNIIDQSKMT